MVSLETYLEALRAAHDGELPLDDDQRKALEHDYDNPLWILAGPGTGKTHTLVWLVLKRILVDGVPPERVFFTTFTRKAAAELESRLILSRQKLVRVGLDGAADVDVSHLLTGTLHSLCSQIMQDERYEPTLRIRLLEDELTQQFFVRLSQNPLLRCFDLGLWRQFGMADEHQKWQPNMAAKAEGACKLFNRMTENSVDVEAMASSENAHFRILADAYVKYEEALRERHRTDQAHLQKHFLDFLATPARQAWLGDGFTVVVDEYQDTNPIQEEIYFRLAGLKADLTVVGDDDQSLYRFRGATVECLIDFDRACRIYLDRTPTPVYLHANRRSHPKIVEWVNRMIAYHPEMKDRTIRVRAPAKPLLDAKAGLDAPYPAVITIAEQGNVKAASKVVQVARDLMAEKLVEDYSQIAILTFSTRETSHAIGTFTKALRDERIPLYNPRNRRAHKDKRLKAMLGALSLIIDSAGAYEGELPWPLPGSVVKYVREARQDCRKLLESGDYPHLVEYTHASADAVTRARYDPARQVNYLTRKGGRRVTCSALLYKLLAYEPFASDLTDIEGGERLKALDLVLSEYESLHDNGELRLEIDDSGSTQIQRGSLYSFYAVFVEGLHDGLNDPEDDEISIQPGMINVMTIHQAKGLEFEVVFVLRPDKQPFPGQTHIMEDELDLFVRRATKPQSRRSRELRAAEDAIRLFYVAYSRAKRLLVLAGSNVEAWDRVLGRDEKGRHINSRAGLESLGVYML